MYHRRLIDYSQFVWQNRTQPSILTTLLIMAYCATSLADDHTLPVIQVKNVRRAFHNGEHNAFTDLIRFRDQIYLTFRSCPDGHMVNPTSSIIVLRSADGEAWQQVNRFNVKHRDTRDPHFLIFHDRLLVYTGTWYSGETTLPIKDYDLNKHLGYVAWTEDGEIWQGPQLLDGTYGHYIWRAAQHDGVAYMCGRRKQDFDARRRGNGAIVQSLLLESDDGFIWRKRAVMQEDRGDETAFLFEPNGDLLAVGRCGSENAQLLRSQPPYDRWLRIDLDRYVGGPLLTKWGEHYLVGGRHATADRGPKTYLYWLSNDRLNECAELPSGGDNSYPGFLQVSPTQALVSWYSSHEKDDQQKTITAIYLADLHLSDQP